MFRIRTAENDFTTFGTGGIAVQVEWENWLFDETLIVEIVEWRDDAIDGNWTVAETENAVEFGGDEYKTWLADGFGKCLVFDVQAADLGGE